MSPEYASAHHIWVTRYIDRICARSVDRPLLVGLFTLGLVPVVLTALAVVTAHSPLPREFLVAHLLAMAVAVVGPSAIWYWDRRVFPKFVSETTDIAVVPSEVQRIAERYKEIFCSQYLIFTVPWTVLILALLVLNAGYFEQIGIGGADSVAFWVYVLFACWWGLITGIGFHGALTAVRTIRAVGESEFEVDPLHPDGLSGLSSIGYLAIWTTMLISLGSLTLPLAFILGTEGDYEALVYLAVAVYTVVIALSFVYPTVYVNRRAQEVREQELEQRRAKIRRLQARVDDMVDGETSPDETATMDEMATRLEIQRLRDEFNEYASVSLYPLSVSIVTRLVSSVLLPFVFTLVDYALGLYL